MPPEDPSPHTAGIVVPLRSFSLGKARLADRLDATARADLARTMADRVVDAAGPRPIVVVSSAPEVLEWAAQRRIATVDDPASLDAAADAGREWVRARRLARVVVVHADLPLVTTLDTVTSGGDAPVVVAVPCHRHDGTPVLAIPSDVPFRFSYGPGSFERHRAEAERLGLELRVLDDPALAFDVDVPDDLDQLAALLRAPAGRTT